MVIAWIELGSDPHRIIFVDGFLPRIEKIKQKLINSGFYPGSSKLSYTSLDDLVGSFIGKKVSGYHKKQSEKRRAKFHNCDLFYSKLLPSQELPLFFKNIAPFYEEIGNENHENYRQLILVYDTGLCKTGRGCMKNLIKSLEFEIKKPGDYNSYQTFREGILKLLDYTILDPYEAPCIVARDRLKKTGFLAESGL